MFTTILLYHQNYILYVTEKEVDKRGRVPTSIKIDPDLWKQAKIEAITHNMELSDMVENALRKELRGLKK